MGAIYLARGHEACTHSMQKRTLSQLINLDKVAYKEVNFKSKLIEWCQKNRVKLDFKLLEQKRDDNNSPIFVYQAIIEGLEGGTGTGFSKKESQQQASKLTLQSLRRKPQFIDAVFAAKANRTKMEEEPVQTVPDVDAKEDFIISKDTATSGGQLPRETTSTTSPTFDEQLNKEFEKTFDLSDIQAITKPLSKEDIVAAAEAEAFK